MFQIIDGKKTYLIVAAMVVYAVLGLVLNLHSSDRATELILLALGMAGLLDAVRKSEK